MTPIRFAGSLPALQAAEMWSPRARVLLLVGSALSSWALFVGIGYGLSQLL